MQPYQTPFFFIILTVALAPLIIAHSFGKKWMGYQFAITLFFLWLTFGGKVQALSLIGWGAFEILLTKLYFLYHKKKNATWVFYGTIILSIIPLFIVKLNPVIDPAHPESILGFLGISYVTFKVVSTIMEIRDGLIKELPLKNFLYFIYFYPTISSGPIDRFRRFEKELSQPFPTENYPKLLEKGIWYIFLGFLYNFIIGYLIDTYWLHQAAIAATTHPGFLTLSSSMYAYGFYLFFNFAGYSLFAVGTSYIMGYETPMNFNQPFRAKNIKDFWNRWHMTLCNWFRDFVYMRLVKFMMIKKFSKSMVVMSNIAYLALFGLMGFWHGFTWFYVVYGFYHAGLMIGYDAWIRFKKKHKLKIPDNRLVRFISIAITFQLVFIGFLIFSGILNSAFLFHFHHGGHPVIPNF